MAGCGGQAIDELTIVDHDSSIASASSPAFSVDRLEAFEWRLTQVPYAGWGRLGRVATGGYRCIDGGRHGGDGKEKLEGEACDIQVMVLLRGRRPWLLAL
jgi:hypothetical protein